MLARDWGQGNDIIMLPGGNCWPLSLSQTSSNIIFWEGAFFEQIMAHWRGFSDSSNRSGNWPSG